MRGLVSLVAVLTLLAFDANAATAPTAQSLLGLCAANGGTEQRLGCHMYIAGYIQGLEVAQVQPQGSLTEICFPTNFTESEAEAVFVRFMRTHGTENHFTDQPPEQVLWVAFSLEYPCKRPAH